MENITFATSKVYNGKNYFLVDGETQEVFILRGKSMYHITLPEHGGDEESTPAEERKQPAAAVLRKSRGGGGVQVKQRKSSKDYDKDAVIADLKSGMKRGDIARKHGISPSLVYYFQGQLGKKIDREIEDHDKGKKQKLESDQIRELHRSGCSISELTLQFPGWSEAEIRRVI